MSNKVLPLLLIVAVMVLVLPNAFAASYTWSVSSGDWSTAGSWTPSGPPVAGDTAVFDGSVISQATVTNTPAPTTTISGILLINNSTTIISPTLGSVLSTITVNGGAAAFQVAAGSVFQYAGSTGLQIILPTGSKGTVSGDVVFTTTINTPPNANIVHRLISVDTDSLVFAGGATFQFAPSTSGSGNPFGTAAGGSVTFLSGATSYQGGTKTGPGLGSGSAMVGGGTNTQTVKWNTGSVHWIWWSVLGASGKHWEGDVVCDIRDAASVYGGTNPTSIEGTYRIKSTSIGKMTWNSTGRLRFGNIIVESGSAGFGITGTMSTITVKGDIDASGTSTPLGGTGTVWTLTGTGNQNLTLTNASTFPNILLNNAAGITLLSTGTTSTLNMVSGNINTGANTLVLGENATNPGTLTRTAGTVIGNFKRWIPASAGAYIFPVGTGSNYEEATVNFTGAPSVGGTLNATFTASDPGDTGLPLSDGVSLDKAMAEGYWTIASGDGLTGGTYDVSLVANGFNFAGGSLSDFRVVKRAPAGSWTLDGSAGTNGGQTIVRTGASGFSEFGIAGPVNEVPVKLSIFSTE